MGIVYRLANLNWVTAALSPLAVILMEVFWLFPWLAWVGKWSSFVWQRPPLSLTSLIFLLTASFFITKFFLSRKWSLKRIQLSIVSCGLLAIFMVVRVEYGAGSGLLSGQWFVQTAQVFLDSFSHPHPVVIAVPIGVYVWWRGIRLGRSPLYFDDIYHSFLVGLAALVALTIVWGSSLGVASLASLTSTVGLYVAGFFFFGLTALSLGNLRAIRERMAEEEEVVLAFSRRWLYILFGVVGGIVLAGIGIASIFSFEFVALLTRLMNLTYALLLRGIGYLFIPLGYLVAGLVYIAQFIMNLLRHGQLQQPFQPPSPSELEKIVEIVPRALPEEAVLVMKWAFFALVAIGVVFLLARSIFRYWSLKTKDEIEEIHESLWSWAGFKADLRLFFSMLRQRLARKRKKPAPESPVPKWRRGENFQGRLSIREIYRHLLWEASRYRIARQRYETPYEYARRLGQAVPDGSEQVSELTNLYINVRYGDLEADDKQVDYANSQWQVLLSLFGRLERNQAG